MKENTYIMFRSTSVKNAERILRDGFKLSGSTACIPET